MMKGLRAVRGKRPDGLCGVDGCGREAIALLLVDDGAVVWLCVVDLEGILSRRLAVDWVAPEKAEVEGRTVRAGGEAVPPGSRYCGFPECMGEAVAPVRVPEGREVWLCASCLETWFAGRFVPRWRSVVGPWAVCGRPLGLLEFVEDRPR